MAVELGRKNTELLITSIYEEITCGVGGCCRVQERNMPLNVVCVCYREICRVWGGGGVG